MLPGGWDARCWQRASVQALQVATDQGRCLGAGEYRNLQQHLTNNAESIAFYGGIEREGSLIRARFRQLVKHQAHLLRTQWRFSMWQVGCWLGPLPPVCLKEDIDEQASVH